MKKIIFFLPMLLTGAITFSQVQFKIAGNVSGLANDSVALSFDDSGTRQTLTTVAKDNRFEFSGKTGKLETAYLYFGGTRSRNYTYLILENGVINVAGDVKTVDEIVISGTAQNSLLTTHRRGENKYYKQVTQLNEKLRAKPDKATEQALTEQIERLRDSVKTYRIAFVDANPGAMASVLDLWVLQDKIDIALLERLTNQLTPEMQQADYVPLIKEKIKGRKRTAIGNPAPAFSTTDHEGKPVTLASLKGKYVLLDFWASWCVPCRAENPYLKAAYAKFAGRDFRIVSVSVDADRKKWLDAVAQDSLPWTHLLDGAWPKNGIAELYGVQPIPDNFLIDPSGKIVARAIRGEELQSRLEKIYSVL